jgi:hypothetical protein
LDGDLGPYDVLEPRLGAADMVIVLDFSLLRCAWRSIRRSHERLDYWRSLFRYRRRSLPAMTAMIVTHAPGLSYACSGTHARPMPSSEQSHGRRLTADQVSEADTPIVAIHLLPHRARRLSPRSALSRCFAFDARCDRFCARTTRLDAIG